MGRRTAWYPRTGNTTIHITNHNWEIISTPGPLSITAPVPANVDAAEVPRYIQHHVSQVDQWHQMINMEDTLKKQLQESLDKKYFKVQCKAYMKYAKLKLSVLVQNLYDYYGTISLMDIEESK